MDATGTAGRLVVRERFTAMGTRAEVQVVDGPRAAVEEALAHIERLEAHWSRFRPTSDVARLNAAAGSWVDVSPETLLLLERATMAARATDGRFDPTVGGAMVAHGYDRTFAEVPDHARDLVPEPVVDGSWPMIELDLTGGQARLPEGTTFDPGGLGKGLAADVVTAALSPEVPGILVNLGGDLRCCGQAPDPAGWVITVDDPFHDGHEIARLAIPEGGVATSSNQQRRWTTAGGPAHHIIDPRTGRPSASSVATVTIVAAEAWWAEVQATAVFLDGPDALARVDGTVEALVVLADGSLHATPAFEAVLP